MDIRAFFGGQGKPHSQVPVASANSKSQHTGTSNSASKKSSKLNSTISAESPLLATDNASKIIKAPATAAVKQDSISLRVEPRKKTILVDSEDEDDIRHKKESRKRLKLTKTASEEPLKHDTSTTSNAQKSPVESKDPTNNASKSLSAPGSTNHCEVASPKRVKTSSKPSSAEKFEFQSPRLQRNSPSAATNETTVSLDVNSGAPLINTLKPLEKVNFAKTHENLVPVTGGATAFFGGVHSQTPSSGLTRAPPGGSRPNFGPITGAPLQGGSREPPNGRPNCLDGLKIAVTGVMNYFSRDQLEDMIHKYGGKVANSVSGKTDMLIAGQVLEDGRQVVDSSKYKTALEKKVKIVTENEFLEQIQASNPTNEPVDWHAANGYLAVDEQKSPPLTNATSFNGNAGAKNSSSRTTTYPFTFPPVNNSSSSSSSSALASTIHTKSDKRCADSLWVDKHRPHSTAELIGSGDVAKKLSDWLRDWRRVHIEKGSKPAFTKENVGAKAVLLSGPPGIGKTTLATLVSDELGYETLELNASDTRSKKAITEQLADAVLSNAIGADGSSHRRLVIMDEVDGMGGSDRGGIPELIKVIKASRSPIICICNDRQSQKIRSLANYCYDLRVRRPTKTQIAQRMMRVAASEGLNIDANAAELLVEQMGNDIRQVINCMQMWRAQSSSARYEDVKARMRGVEKDRILRHSPFDACQDILGGPRNASLDDRYNSFFIDYALVPLLIQQNYIDSARNGIFKQPGISDCQAMETLSSAADAVSDMEMAGSSIRGQDQHWELLPTQAAMCLAVGSHIRGFQGFPTFPAWLGKNSTTGRIRRLVQELVTHTSLSIGQGFTAIRLEYTPYIRTALLAPLKARGSDGVEDVLLILDSYGLSRDDMFETIKELQLIVEKDPLLRDQYEDIDTKTKTALTRVYNQSEHRSQALVSSTVVGKKSSVGRRMRDVDDDDEGLEEATTEDLAAAKADEDEKESDDVGDVSAFVKKTKAVAAKNKKNNTAPANKKSKK